LIENARKKAAFGVPERACVGFGTQLKVAFGWRFEPRGLAKARGEETRKPSGV
jgi:hypothetical protein